MIRIHRHVPIILVILLWRKVIMTMLIQTFSKHLIWNWNAQWWKSIKMHQYQLSIPNWFSLRNSQWINRFFLQWKKKDEYRVLPSIAGNCCLFNTDTINVSKKSFRSNLFKVYRMYLCDERIVQLNLSWNKYLFDVDHFLYLIIDQLKSNDKYVLSKEKITKISIAFSSYVITCIIFLFIQQ